MAILRWEKTFDPGFNIEENLSVSMHVIDCLGWHNVDDVLGCTNAIMNHQNNYLEDDDGNYIAFIT